MTTVQRITVEAEVIITDYDHEQYDDLVSACESMADDLSDAIEREIDAAVEDEDFTAVRVAVNVWTHDHELTKDDLL